MCLVYYLFVIRWAVDEGELFNRCVCVCFVFNVLGCWWRGIVQQMCLVYDLFMCWAVDEGELFNICVWCMICLWCVGMLMRGDAVDVCCIGFADNVIGYQELILLNTGYWYSFSYCLVLIVLISGMHWATILFAVNCEWYVPSRVCFLCKIPWKL